MVTVYNATHVAKGVRYMQWPSAQVGQIGGRDDDGDVWIRVLRIPKQHPWAAIADIQLLPQLIAANNLVAGQAFPSSRVVLVLDGKISVAEVAELVQERGAPDNDIRVGSRLLL